MPECRVAFDSSKDLLINVSVHELEKNFQSVHNVSNETSLPSGLLYFFLVGISPSGVVQICTVLFVLLFRSISNRCFS